MKAPGRRTRGPARSWRAARVVHQNTERAAVQQKVTPTVPSHSLDSTVRKDASYKVALNRRCVVDGKGAEHCPDRINGRSCGCRRRRHRLRRDGGEER